MRHGKKINHLGRKSAHRKAMLSNMASSLIIHKRITTTTAKAKALRKYVEPIINRSKDDTTHSRRMVFRQLQDKHAVSELFREVAVKVADRPGGYTRILKTGNRLGDNAEMCIIELVDYNEAYTAQKETKTKRTRRRRSSTPKTETVAQDTLVAEETKEVAETEETPKAETTEETTTAEETPVVEETSEETTEEE
ncbi:MAG: 50S ribosomal protein L17 [Bacteroidales bacterium]|jgi:large subunit ribosomal protein L17|nr:50S ribosomal protein L17 [Bacteroidales bacterium]